MLDAQGRIVIPSEQLERVGESLIGKKIQIYFDSENRSLNLRMHDVDYGFKEYKNMYYIATHILNQKGRIFIPKVIREAFPNATYLPAEKDGEIFILII